MAANVDLVDDLEERTATVNAALDRELAGGSPRYLYDACRHLVEAGGKRLRPVLLLLVAETVDPDGELDGYLPAAVAVELVHTLSLIHDDIINDDDLRRGVPSVHTAWDRSTGLVAGDLLYARAFDLVTRVEAPPATQLEAVRRLAGACRSLSEGQALDMTLDGEGGPPSEEEYLRIVEEKTGALFAAAAEIGALLAGGDDMEVDAASDYGRALGTAFQLRDDVLDIAGTTDVLGKSVGRDLLAGKATLVSIHAEGHDVDVTPGRVDVKGVGVCLDDLEDAGSLDYVERRAQRYVGRALSALEAFEPSEARGTLAELAKFAVERER